MVLAKLLKLVISFSGCEQGKHEEFKQRGDDCRPDTICVL